MYAEAHKSIDVDVFKQILTNEFFPESKSETNETNLQLIQRLNLIEMRLPGLDLDLKKTALKIEHQQFGFKKKSDFKIEFKSEIIDNETILYLISVCIYELQDEIKKLPIPHCEKGNKLRILMGDAFERLKVKTQNILHYSDNDEQIIHYAKKNIQVSLQNCHNARQLLVKIQKTKNQDAIVLVFMANVFMINVVSYLFKTFSNFHTDYNSEKVRQKALLFDVMDLDLMMEPKVEYQTKTADEKTDEAETACSEVKIKWNMPVTSLISMIYDFQHTELDDKSKAIEVSNKDVQTFLNQCFVDKNGKPINKATVKTALCESRDDKRAKGRHRIDISRFLS